MHSFDFVGLFRDLSLIQLMTNSIGWLLQEVASSKFFGMNTHVLNVAILD